MAIPEYERFGRAAPGPFRPFQQPLDASLQQISGKGCKYATLGRVLIYASLILLILIVFGGIVFATTFMLRYFSSQFFVQNAVLSACAASASIHSSAMSSCAQKLAGTEFSISYVTIGSEEAAEALASKIVEKQLAACVNIIPKVKSVYKWKGKIEKDEEVLMMVKSRFSRVHELTTFIRENHPYEVCEVISLPIHHGNPSYLNWLGDNVPSVDPPNPN